LDNNIAIRGSLIDGIPVVIPSEFTDSDMPVIIAVSKFYGDIIGQLRRLGTKTILPYAAFMRSGSTLYDRSVIRPNIRRFERGANVCFELESVDFVVTEKCSLKCRDCSNLMQYFNHPTDSDFDELTVSFDRLYHAVDYIYEVRILGGEPLICGGLPYYLEFLKKYDRIGSVIILTNGTLHFGAKLMKSMNDPRLSVRISDYGLHSQKPDAVTAELDRARVVWSVISPQEWQQCALVHRYNRDESELADIMANCCMRNTPAIKNGKLWRCPFAGNLASLKALPDNMHEYVELYKSLAEPGELRQQIENMIKLPYIKVCDYCPGRPYTGYDAVIPAVQAADTLELIAGNLYKP
jgi:organic radical activating enzyme